MGFPDDEWELLRLLFLCPFVLFPFLFCFPPPLVSFLFVLYLFENEVFRFLETLFPISVRTRFGNVQTKTNR